MPAPEPLTCVRYALDAIGLTLGAFDALSPWEQRQRFPEALRAALAPEGASLVSADLGRRGVCPVWVVSVHSPRKGVQVFHAAFDGETDLHAPHVLGALIGRLRAALNKEHDHAAH